MENLDLKTARTYVHLYSDIKTAYLYNSYDGDILIYDINKGHAVPGPVTWCMNTYDKSIKIRL